MKETHSLPYVIQYDLSKPIPDFIPEEKTRFDNSLISSVCNGTVTLTVDSITFGKGIQSILDDMKEQSRTLHNNGTTDDSLDSIIYALQHTFDPGNPEVISFSPQYWCTRLIISKGAMPYDQYVKYRRFKKEV